MDAKRSILTNLALADMVVGQYLGDLTDAELFVRPVPGANHIAWQWGHLISSERWVLERVAPGKTAALPEGFDAAHKKETAPIDDPARFCTKQQYAELATQVRAGTGQLLADLSDADLDRPIEKMIPAVQVVSDLFIFIGMHWLMHTGQWAIVRRKLGRPPLF